MEFKIGDKVRYKVTKEDWKEYWEQEGIVDSGIHVGFLDLGEINDILHPAPLTIIDIQDETIKFRDAQGNEADNLFWTFTYYSNPKSSYTTKDGFYTDPNNWKKGLDLL